MVQHGIPCSHATRDFAAYTASPPTSTLPTHQPLTASFPFSSRLSLTSIFRLARTIISSLRLSRLAARSAFVLAQLEVLLPPTNASASSVPSASASAAARTFSCSLNRVMRSGCNGAAAVGVDVVVVAALAPPAAVPGVVDDELAALAAAVRTAGRKDGGGCFARESKRQHFLGSGIWDLTCMSRWPPVALC